MGSKKKTAAQIQERDATQAGRANIAQQNTAALLNFPKNPVYFGERQAARDPRVLEAEARNVMNSRPLVQSGQNLINLGNRYSSADFLQNPSSEALGVLDINTQNLNDNFNRNIMPGIGSAASRSGAFGGSRQGIVEGQAHQGLSNAIYQGGANLLYADLQNRQNLANNAGNLMNQGAQLQQYYPNALASQGAAAQGYAQQGIDIKRQIHNENLNAPFLGPQLAAGLTFIGKDTLPPSAPNPAISAGLGAASGAAAGGISAGPYGALAGGIIGGATGYFG